MARRHLQAAYTGLQKLLQYDWEFVHQFTLGVGKTFQKVEDALQRDFLLALFQGYENGTTGQGVT